MIFIFILLFGVLFLFVNIRQVAPGNRGSIAAGLAVIALPVCFIFRGHLWASVGQAFLAVWLCEALLLYIFWWLFRGIRRLAVRRALPRQVSIMGARALLALSVLVSAVMCVAGYFHNADYYLRRTDVDLPGDSHFTALFFSDLHLDPLFDRDKALRILHDADSVRPDFIFFGGDLSDEHDSLMTLEGYDAIFREMAGKARLGAFAVDGNHEAYMERSGSDPHGWLRRNGWTVLEDSTACTELACITGRIDHQVAHVRGVERLPLDFIAPAKDSRVPWIVLDHQPRGLDSLDTRKPDFALSGHTHDGQFFPGTVIINWVWRIAYGFGELDGIKWLVTSGVHSWGPPVRVGSDAEMWILDFK